MEIDEAPFLAITGKGAPGGVVFTEVTEALYTLGYGIKGLCKKDEARAAAIAKKKDLAPLHGVAFEILHEGLCVQMMHIGPYAAEPDTIAQIRKYMRERKLVLNGLHHEIYLSDPRKTAPAAMKTILRFRVTGATIK